MFGKLKPVEHEGINGEIVYTCPLCSKEVEKNAKKCKNCGQDLKWDNKKKFKLF